MLFKVAFRSIFRNLRRSAVTTLAISVGCMASLLFGAFTIFTNLGFLTLTVQRTGHLAIFQEGYFEFGAGNPAAYGVSNAAELLMLINADEVLAPQIRVATPILSVFGIAGNFDGDQYRTFAGVGFIPSDRDKMRQWNQYGAGRVRGQRTGMNDDVITQGTLGPGLARILGLCERLNLANCRTPPKQRSEEPEKLSGEPNSDFDALIARDLPANENVGSEANLPRIDLLGATAGGAPNVVSLYVGQTEYQGIKDVDDSYVGMHLKLAQQLLYGRSAPKVTGILLQLHRTEDLEAARLRLRSLFSERGAGLEVRDFTELTPLYNQVIGFNTYIFSFIASIMSVIVLFTVINTMTMTVVERTTEIGTVRALGGRRRMITVQFLIEGCLLGIFGATFGLLCASIAAYVINGSGIGWTPPAAVEPVPLRLYLFTQLWLPVGTWLTLVIVATAAAFVPAHRASKLKIVDALRHV